MNEKNDILKISKAVEDHNHQCVDELCKRGINAINYIVDTWRKNNLTCKTIKNCTGKDALALIVYQLENMQSEVSLLCYGD